MSPLVGLPLERATSGEGTARRTRSALAFDEFVAWYDVAGEQLGLDLGNLQAVFLLLQLELRLGSGLDVGLLRLDARHLRAHAGQQLQRGPARLRRLAGGAVLAGLPAGLSAIYFFYDPEQRQIGRAHV